MMFYRKPTYKYAIFIGFSIGFTIITRPTDIILLIFPLLWPLQNGGFKQRLIFFSDHKLKILLSILAASMLVILQMAYWKYTAGQYIFYSYGDEGFNFYKPAVIKGLFSYQKGWFIYTPMVLICFFGVIRAIFLERSNNNFIKKYSILLIIYYSITVYVLFSWWMWYYGGSFGSRVLSQSYPLLGLPFAYLIENIVTKKNALMKKMLFFSLIIWFMFLNIFQTYQYHRGIIHHDRMSKDYYWKAFLKLNVSEEDRGYLLTDEELYNEVNARRRNK